MPSIVIIGASFAGTSASKILFNEIASSAQKKDYDITVIATSDKIFYNPAAPRLVVEPELTNKAFLPAENYVKKYARGVPFKFLKGTVDTVDLDTKKVRLADTGEHLSYDFLIIASGSHSQSAAFKLNGHYTESSKEVADLAARLKNADTIAILGGGATGVETAGEVAYAYPKKKVTLFTGALAPLSFIDKGPQATKKLQKLGVTIVNDLKFTSIVEKEDEGEGTTIHFENGKSQSFDAYVPTYGVAPNTGFLSEKHLDKDGYILVDKYLRVRNHSEVIVTGDAAAGTANSIVDIVFGQTKPLTATIRKEIFKKGNLVEYSPVKNTIVIPVSRAGGVGLAFGVSFPSFLVKYAKGKDFSLGAFQKEFKYP